LFETEVNLSVINQIEALGFNFENQEEAQKCLQFVNASTVYALNDQVVNQTIALRKQLKIKLPDAIVAATALTQGLAVLTRNAADFQKIPGLTVVNPFELSN